MLKWAAMNKVPQNSQSNFDVNLRLLHLGSEQSSSWMNLGYWAQDNLNYPEACRALAEKLGNQGELRPGHSILDVGCGCGEQLRHWRTAFQAGTIHGVEPSPSHVERAKSLTRELQNITVEEACSDTFIPKKEGYDRVLCLDTAYNFPQRPKVFLRAYESLHKKGMIALTDLVLEDRAKPNRIRDFFARKCGIPPENLLNRRDYQFQLEEIGFTNVRIHSINEAVFGGFYRFVRHLSRRYRWETLHIDWLKIWLTARACRFFLKTDSVHYSLISARKA